MSLLFLVVLWWASFTFVTSNVLTYAIPEPLKAAIAHAKPAAQVSSPFTYYFSADGKLPEASNMNLTWSPYWWVNSGAYLFLKDGAGQTVHGSLPFADPWRVLYSTANPVDTDNGYHPQNIFRLVSRSTWSNVRLQATFKIVRDNFSSSPNRNASNGILFMSRYVDGNTLYYAGIRVDGTAVIKKKYKGTYYTMAQKEVFDGDYSSGENVNLLPHGQWFHLRSETVTNGDGSVTVRLYLRKPDEPSLVKVLEARDTGTFGGTPPITATAHTGIRTDFMDVSFDSFMMETL